MRRSLLTTPTVALMFLLAPILKADLISVGSASVPVATTFDLPVTISGSSDLYAFQFDLSFDPSILQLNSITEGLFLASAGPTFFIPGTIDNTLGIATFTADTLIGAIPGAAGAGNLAVFNFQAVAGGLDTLTLSNVVLLDSTLSDISFTQQSGQVSVGSTVPEPNSAWLLALVVTLCLWLKQRPLPR